MQGIDFRGAPECDLNYEEVYLAVTSQEPGQGPDGAGASAQTSADSKELQGKFVWRFWTSASSHDQINKLLKKNHICRKTKCPTSGAAEYTALFADASVAALVAWLAAGGAAQSLGKNSMAFG